MYTRHDLWPLLFICRSRLRCLLHTVADLCVGNEGATAANKTVFDVAALLQFSADELADPLHTTTKTLRTHRQDKNEAAQ
jgi:hypothetical protein